jgi:hypothetical protein
VQVAFQHCYHIEQILVGQMVAPATYRTHAFAAIQNGVTVRHVWGFLKCDATRITKSTDLHQQKNRHGPNFHANHVFGQFRPTDVGNVV